MTKRFAHQRSANVTSGDLNMRSIKSRTPLSALVFKPRSHTQYPCLVHQIWLQKLPKIFKNGAANLQSLLYCMVLVRIPSPASLLRQKLLMKETKVEMLLAAAAISHPESVNLKKRRLPQTVSNRTEPRI